MTQPNLILFEIPEAELAEIRASVDTLRTKLLPRLKTLSPAERHELPKMGDKTISFVLKTVEHCRQNPDLVLPFLDVAELAADAKAVELIRTIYQPLLQITESLEDTMTLSGSEAYTASLMFYNAVKNAAKSKIPKAETIYTASPPAFPLPEKKKPSRSGRKEPEPELKESVLALQESKPEQKESRTGRKESALILKEPALVLKESRMGLKEQNPSFLY